MALCALLTLPGGPRGFIDTPRGPMGFPYLKIEKLANYHFMFLDRYEIHIQDFEDLLRDLHHFWVSVFTQFDKNEIPEIFKTWYIEFQEKTVLTFSFLNLLISHIYKNNIFEKVSICSYIC